MEYLYNGFRLKQHKDCFKLGVDSVLLANFAKTKSGFKICDLGCGGGAISIILLSKNKNLYIDGIELQRNSCILARYNSRINNIKNHFKVYNENINNNSRQTGYYDMIISNPPYFHQNSGETSKNENMKIARSEQECTLADICNCASRLLKYGGNFNIVHKADRLADIFFYLKISGLEPKRMRFVAHTEKSSPKLVLIEARKAGNSGLICEKTLILKNYDGSESDELKKIYHR